MHHRSTGVDRDKLPQLSQVFLTYVQIMSVVKDAQFIRCEDRCELSIWLRLRWPLKKVILAENRQRK